MNKIIAIPFIMSFMVITHAQTMDMWDGTADTTWYNTTDTFLKSRLQSNWRDWQ